MTSPMLSFQQVSFGYQRSRPVLTDLTFDLHPGRIAAILGPNGAGKTTLLHLALGWLKPWGGQVVVADQPLSHLSPRARGRLLALVPQNEHTPFDYTVLDYVLLGRAPHLPPLGMPTSEDYAAAGLALQQVGLSDLANHPVPQLSGGEHQLMLIARAMAQQPRLLLLDEPGAHLDLHNRARLVALLRTLRAAGTTILMTSHDPEVVLAVSDDLLLLESGLSPRLGPQFGPLDEVLTAPALSRLYGIPIRLVEVDGRKQVLWT